MLRVKKVQVVEALSAEELQDEINSYIERNKNETVMDIKINIYVTDLPEELWEEDYLVIPKEERHSAMLIIGEEI